MELFPNGKSLHFRKGGVIFLKTTDFPNEKTVASRKPLLEAEFIDYLSNGHLNFPPARLQLVNVARGVDAGYDGILEAEWKQGHARYVFEYKANSQPRTLEAAQWKIRAIAERERLLPLVILPYLSEQALSVLEDHEISGIDMSGNGLLIAPDFRIWRTGNLNQFKDNRPIRNPYRGDSSIFARCFLIRPSFNSLTQLQEFAHTRIFALDGHPSSSNLTLSTASKVVQALVDEMVLGRQGNAIHLLDARRLLLFLRRGFSNVARPTIVGKTSLTPSMVWTKLSEARDKDQLRSVATGIASAGHYRLLSGVDMLSLYVSDSSTANDILEVRPGRAFANIQIFEERKHVVYFDARPEHHTRWASPIQSWLELANAGPREQEAAEELERLLLNGHGETL